MKTIHSSSLSKRLFAIYPNKEFLTIFPSKFRHNQPYIRHWHVGILTLIINQKLGCLIELIFSMIPSTTQSPLHFSASVYVFLHKFPPTCKSQIFVFVAVRLPLEACHHHILQLVSVCCVRHHIVRLLQTMLGLWKGNPKREGRKGIR